ncbi:MAG: SpoIIE family protein phosphatase [Oscillospiraceae bacterium]
MGTGPGAAQESESALRILTGLLQAGMPGAEALGTLNDLYVLRETGGFSTADLLELHLDTGRASLYKWGAAPSYLKHRRSAKRMGTAAPPPGVGIGEAHQAEVIRLSLQKEEMVVLISDGLESEETQSQIADFTGQTPKALAAALVAAAPAGEADDRTAVAVCLRPLSSRTT